jgi:hypothetical protein
VTRKPEIHFIGEGEVRFAGAGGISARTKKITDHEFRLLVPGPGRPRTLDVATERRLQKRLHEWLSSFRGDSPKTNSLMMREAVQTFAKAEGAPPDCSWRVLRERIVHPVRRELRRRK